MDRRQSDLASAGIGYNIAREFGDGGGNNRSVSLGKPDPCRERSCFLPSCHDVLVRADGHPDFPSCHSRSLSLCVLEFLRQISKTLFQVQRRGHPFESEPQLNHGKRHLRLNANNHRFRSAEPYHVGDLP